MELCCHGGQTLSCKALNLSVEGMLLETGDITLSTGALVDLHIHTGAGDMKIPAAVIHSNTGCTGVMFHRPQPDLYRMITQPLNHGRSTIAGRVPLGAGG